MISLKDIQCSLFCMIFLRIRCCLLVACVMKMLVVISVDDDDDEAIGDVLWDRDILR